MSGEVSPSGRDTPERPVREKFKKTTIDGQAENPDSEDVEVTGSGEIDRQADNSTILDESTHSNGERGRVRRKRSHEELNNDESLDELTNHSRKKSREAKDGRTGEEALSSASSDADSGGVLLSKATSSIATKEMNETENKSVERSETPPADTDNIMAEAEGQRSPPTKRNRDKYDQDHKSTDEMPSVSEVLQNSSEVSKSLVGSKKQDGISEPDSKRKKDGTQLPAASGSTEIPSGSGFANASSVSPFASLAQGKSSSSTSQTSPSAFAASGFAALSSSTLSPFASLSGSTQGASSGGFGPPLAASSSTDKPAPSGFAALGASSKPPFATTSFGSASSSGFGQLGGAKSIFSASSGPLKSFASPAGSATIGASKKPPKPFGASEDADEDDDEQNENDDNDTEPADDDDEHQDSRFHAQEVETGEEDENTIFQGRAKLFVSQDQTWKERGVGIFKVNVKREHWDFDEDEEGDEQKGKSRGETTARFVMRADGSHRIVINSKITKEITIDDPAKGPPKGKMAIFLGFFDGKPQTVLVRFRTNALATELHETVKEIQKDM